MRGVQERPQEAPGVCFDNLGSNLLLMRSIFPNYFSGPLFQLHLQRLQPHPHPLERPTGSTGTRVSACNSKSPDVRRL